MAARGSGGGRSVCRRSMSSGGEIRRSGLVVVTGAGNFASGAVDADCPGVPSEPDSSARSAQISSAPDSRSQPMSPLAADCLAAAPTALNSHKHAGWLRIVSHSGVSSWRSSVIYQLDQHRLDPMGVPDMKHRVLQDRPPRGAERRSVPPWRRRSGRRVAGSPHGAASN